MPKKKRGEARGGNPFGFHVVLRGAKSRKNARPTEVSDRNKEKVMNRESFVNRPGRASNRNDERREFLLLSPV